MTKPRILFFARGYQADFFPTLQSDRYEAVFVTMTRAERDQVRRRGCEVVACFEADFDRLPVAPVPENYLITSLMSDRFLGRFDRAERLTILGKEIAFWSDLLDRYTPVAVVNELVAIEISEVLLIEARKRGIRYLAGMNNVVDDWFYWIGNPMTLSGKYLASPEPTAEARSLARAYITELKAKDYRPFYVKNLAGRRALKPLLIGLAKAVVWSWRARRTSPFRYEVYDEEYTKRVSVYFKSLVLGYDQIEDLPADGETIFYPLHQEPEATLNYMSEFNASQPATIENILKCLGPHQVLAVKEHPVDKGSLLRGKFQQLKKRYSNLYFFPGELHGREVLARSGRVVTLTSTVGWEAAATGKPVHVLGEIWYDHVSGIDRVTNWPDLRAALRRSPADQPRMTEETLEDFVATMVAASYPGNPFPHAGLYSQQNIDKVIRAVVGGAGL
ncbi:MAG: hypothetical protein V4537_16430 [Pseudomonadota bacterium]